MKKRMSRYGIGNLLFGMILCISGFAQTQETIQYRVIEKNIYTKAIGVEEGLPSSETYNVFQDSKGYIWISTDRGLARYNGTNMKVFTVQDGLPDNVVFELFEDSQGWIWIESMNGRASYIKNDTVYLLDNLQEQLKLDFYPGQYYNITEDEKGNIWFGYNKDNGKITKYNKQNNSLIAVDVDTSESGLNTILKKFNNNNYVYPVGFKTKLNSDSSLRKPENIFSIFTDSTEEHIPINVNDLLPGFGARVTKSLNGVYVFSSEQYLFFVYKKNSVWIVKKMLMKNYTSMITSDRNNNIWVGVINDGLYKLNINNDFQTVDHYLAGSTVSGICLDLENSLWISTVEHGIMYCKNANFSVPIDIRNTFYNKTVEMKPCESVMQIGLQNGEWYSFHASDYVTFKKTKSDIFHFLCINDSLFIIEPSEKNKLGFNWYYHGDTQKKKLDKFMKISNGYFTDEISAGWIGNLLRYKTHQKSTWEDIRCASKIQSVIYKNGFLFVGTTVGLRSINTANNKVEILSESSLDIVKLLFYDSTLLIATKGDGIHQFKNGVIHKMNVNLPNQSCNDMAMNQNKLYVASGGGVTEISLVDLNSRFLNKNHGLPSNEVTKVEIFKNDLWALSPKSVTVIPLNYAWENTIAPLVWVESMTINDTLVFTHQKLKPTENNMTISLASSTYKDAENKQYQYRFDDETQWRSYSGNELAFINLPPNDYVLEIKAVNADGVSSVTPAKMEFTIMAPWYATKWFVAGVLGFMILLIYLGLKARSVAVIKKIEKDESHKRQLSEMELKALRSQMNPHFLFNAINSIQYFLVKNRSGEAKEYLSKFSLLVRNVLNHSRQDFITINEEVNGLKLYMDIEKLRFENEFNYEIQVAEGLDLDFDKVPVMIIQPFIENAIWHGIMQKKEGHGEITLKFEVQDDFMVVVITDNGIGRAESERLKQQRLNNKRTSLGIQIIKERINLFNTYRTNKMKFTTIDLYSEKGEAMGTKVIIYIPFS